MWDWRTMGLGRSEIGTQWDSNAMELVQDGTGTQRNWVTVGLGHSRPFVLFSVMSINSVLPHKQEILPIIVSTALSVPTTLSGYPLPSPVDLHFLRGH